MGRLYDLASQLNSHLESRHSGDAMALLRAKGELATRVGFLVTLITKQDIDDPAKIRKLEDAAVDLGVLSRDRSYS